MNQSITLSSVLIHNSSYLFYKVRTTLSIKNDAEEVEGITRTRSMDTLFILTSQYRMDGAALTSSGELSNLRIAFLETEWDIELE